MATQRLSWPAPVKGLDTDMQRPGTAHRIFDFIPWRNGIRKRGKIVTANANGMGDSLSPQEAFGGAPGWLSGKGWIAVESNAVDLDSGSAVHLTEDLGTRTASLGAISLSAFGAGAGNLMGVDVYCTQPVERWFQAGDDLIGLAPGATGTSIGLVRWAGATTADDSALTGTVTTTAGSQRVTGSGTSFTTELEVGMFVLFDAASAPSNGRKWHRVAAIESNTLLYLDTGVEAAFSGVTATATSVVPLVVNPPTVVQSPLFSIAWPTGTTTYGNGRYSNTPRCEAACFHQGRLFCANINEAQQLSTSQTAELAKQKTDTIRWSALANEYSPDTSIVNASNIWRGIEYFDSNARLDVGGAGGAITGLVSWNDALVVLREQSVQIVTGAFATDGTDLGATVQTVARNAGCWSTGAWDVGEQGVFFCDAAGAYLWDGRQVRNLTAGRISQLWEVYYQASTNSAPKQVSCLRNRVLFSSGEDNPDVWLSYWPAYDAWFQLNVDNDDEQTNRVVRNYLDDELLIDESGWQNFRYMLEWDSTDNNHLKTDENGAADASYPSLSVTLNPQPCADGFYAGRTLQATINHSGKQNTYGNGSEGSVLIEVIPAPAFESTVIGASQGSTYVDFPDPRDAATNEVSRAAMQNPDTAVPGTHMMVKITPSGGVPATAADKAFTYTMWGFALDVDVDDKYAD